MKIPRGRVAACRDGVEVGCRMVPLSPSLSGPRRCPAPRTVAYRPRYSTRRIFLAVSASPSCAESEGSMEVLYPVCCALDVHQASVTACLRAPGDGPQRRQDRKSTRLNSSHRCISYAVFCLKKKKKIKFYNIPYSVLRPLVYKLNVEC